ncbi:hypothetical protein [Candidatus Rickettsia colombianensi]|nr:hypothetical protein [Candidatus Rickettsia colombianensi]
MPWSNHGMTSVVRLCSKKQFSNHKNISARSMEFRVGEKLYAGGG